ncbi:MAG: hypothetical protein AAGF12_00580 [Myxococcota bacterium]
MVSGKDLTLPPGARCEKCGQPLEGSPFWVTDYPKAVHETCRDWSTVAWPYAREQRALKRLARELRETWIVVVDTAWHLSAARRGWPQNGARVVADCRQALDRVEAKIRRLGSAPRWLGRR